MKTNPISVVQDPNLRQNPYVVQTRPRQTELPASRRFASELKSAAVQGAGSLLRVGGAMMGAALPAGDSLAAAVPGAKPGSLAEQATGGSMMDQSMELLSLQQQIQMENQRYTLLSNVLKARHETNKNAIGNLR